MTDGSYKMVGIGEVLWDLLPMGKQLGGAPANFAYIAGQLGNKGIVASRVGNDGPGVEIIERLKSFGLDCEGIQLDEHHPTGSVLVNIENGQPVYDIVEGVAWDFLELTNAWLEIAQNADAVCFGSLAQRSEISREVIRAFVSSTKENALRIFDVNLRQRYFSSEILKTSLELANVCKLNHEELPMVSGLIGNRNLSPIDSAKLLLEEFELKLVCITRGAEGSLLISENEVSEIPGLHVEVKDTIGAGDAFTAAMTHGLLRDWNLDMVNEKANEVGAFVASRSGAMPKFPENAVFGHS